MVNDCFFKRPKFTRKKGMLAVNILVCLLENESFYYGARTAIKRGYLKRGFLRSPVFRVDETSVSSPPFQPRRICTFWLTGYYRDASLKSWFGGLISSYPSPRPIPIYFHCGFLRCAFSYFIRFTRYTAFPSL